MQPGRCSRMLNRFDQILEGVAMGDTLGTGCAQKGNIQRGDAVFFERHQAVFHKAGRANK